MGGFFGVISKDDCVNDLFYGTDYHSHLGTKRGGLVVKNSNGMKRFIHDITTAPFRPKFKDDIEKLHGNKGIGIISDYEDQPLIIGSNLGIYAIVTVGKINNLESLAADVFAQNHSHFSEMSGGEINPTELVSILISQESTFVKGIQKAQDLIDGSCSILLLTEEGIYAARDKHGRIPIIIGEKPGSFAITMETCAFPNLDYSIKKYLGPGEIVLVTKDSIEIKSSTNDKLRICSFLWVYYGYPASNYEGINTEVVRNRCGAILAQNEKIEIDMVAGIPDSGTAHGIGYSNEAHIPYKRPFVKYTPTWPRSFMPQDQQTRSLVAKMKLIPIRELIDNKKILFCEDSIVRGTQLRDTIQRLFDYGAKEIHMRPACPPLIYGCKYLNFSRSRSEMELAGRWAMKEIEGDDEPNLEEYANTESEKYKQMVDVIRKRMNLTTLKYQKLENLIKAIGLPKEKLCTYCWDGHKSVPSGDE